MIIKVTANGIVLPSPISISINDEVIWSSDTGRTTSGIMVGDVVTQKVTVSIEWGYLLKEEYDIIHNAIYSAKFFPVVIEGLDIDITAYRGAITKIPTNVGGDIYYKSSNVDFIER